LHQNETCFAQLVYRDKNEGKKLNEVELGVQNYVLKTIFSPFRNHLFIPTGPAGLIIGGSTATVEPQDKHEKDKYVCKGNTERKFKCECGPDVAH
jgi:hypothetical protein